MSIRPPSKSEQIVVGALASEINGNYAWHVASQDSCGGEGENVLSLIDTRYTKGTTKNKVIP